MFSWIKNALGIADAADKIMGGLDDLITSDEERLKIKQAIQIKMAELAREEEADLNKRHKYDMESDSWLSKNIRPLCLIFVLGLLLLVVVASFVPTIAVSSAVMKLVEALATFVFSFYFGGRSVEKAIKMWKEEK